MMRDSDNGRRGEIDHQRFGLYADSCRFQRMMELACQDASDEEFIRSVPGIDESTIDVCRKIARGQTANFGNEAHSKAIRDAAYRHKGPRGVHVPTARDRMCVRMYREGQQISTIARTTGLSRTGVRLAIDRYTQWEDEKGSGIHAGHYAGKNAGADRGGD